jgi:hypothetical protein
VISREDHDRKMAEIQRQIDYAGEMMRKKADETLRHITDNYQKNLMERIAEELEMHEQYMQTGDTIKAKHHRIRAEVYRSTLNAVRDRR